MEMKLQCQSRICGQGEHPTSLPGSAEVEKEGEQPVWGTSLGLP